MMNEEKGGKKDNTFPVQKWRTWRGLADKGKKEEHCPSPGRFKKEATSSAGRRKKSVSHHSPYQHWVLRRIKSPTPREGIEGRKKPRGKGKEPKPHPEHTRLEEGEALSWKEGVSPRGPKKKSAQHKGRLAKGLWQGGKQQLRPHSQRARPA